MTQDALLPRLAGDVAVVRDLQNTLAQGRRDVLALHRAGALGVQVSAALTDLYDRVIDRAYRDAIERVPAAGRPRVLRDLALVAVGGYGRGDLAPYSDVDLLFLHAPRAHPAVRDLSAFLVRDLWDIGLKLGHSVRSPTDCVAFARRDLHLRTALIEARLLTGSPLLFAELQRRIHRLLSAASLNRFLEEALTERAKEHQDYYAATVYLLEPNVKKSPGGLRDLHLLRWIGLTRYGTPEVEMLRIGGILGGEDAHVLAGGGEFLARLRNELHFHAESAQDVLTRDEQIRLAGWLGYETQGGLLGVERFMQQYYRHTTAIHDAVMRFTEGARRRKLWRGMVNRLMTERVEEHFLLDRERVAIDAAAGNGVLGHAETLLRLFDLARQRRVRVAHETLDRIRAVRAVRDVTPSARSRFLAMLAEPAGLGGMLRDLHRVGLLSRLLPAFEHARCLIQFNRYHKYTVDEHSLRAVEAAARRAEDPGPLGRAYRDIRRKDIFHLALLLHDLGKGLGEDHCEVGKRIAEETAAQFALSDHERDLLVFLVHRHLLMAHTAFRRDVNDDKTLLQFARRVGTPEALRKLYVLTAADTEAVSPGSWTAWKEMLLSELYDRAMEALAGGAPVADERARADEIRQRLRGALLPDLPAEWLDAQLAAMPPSYLLATDPPRVAEHLRALRTFDPRGVRVVSDYGRETGLTQYTVLTRDDLTPGLFSKIAGVLAAEGFQIVSAQIVTRSDGVVIDTFGAIDSDYEGEPPPERRRKVVDQIEQVLLGNQTVEVLFARRGTAPRRDGGHVAGPTQVEIDNESSDRFTIIEVFADDRQGLLYVIARTLFELGLSVSSARVSTRTDQVADVFYATDRESGRKIDDAARLEAIRVRLVEAIGAF